MSAVEEVTIETRRGLRTPVRVQGEGPPLLYLHGASGLAEDEPLLDALAARHRIHAPRWPGYSDEEGEERLEDMLDFALHGWDIVEALSLDAAPVLAGHSMGGMIAAEMAAIAPGDLQRLVLIDALGLWIDEHPIPDLFAMLPFQLAAALFRDAKAGEKFLMKGLDFSNADALTNLLVGNARSLGTAGKILFPIPNRRTAKRLYRVRAETLVVWGRQDVFTPPVYAERWRELLPNARIAWIDDAAHMAPYEQPKAIAEAMAKFLG